MGDDGQYKLLIKDADIEHIKNYLSPYASMTLETFKASFLKHPKCLYQLRVPELKNLIKAIRDRIPSLSHTLNITGNKADLIARLYNKIYAHTGANAASAATGAVSAASPPPYQVRAVPQLPYYIAPTVPYHYYNYMQQQIYYVPNGYPFVRFPVYQQPYDVVQQAAAVASATAASMIAYYYQLHGVQYLGPFAYMYFGMPSMHPPSLPQSTADLLVRGPVPSGGGAVAAPAHVEILYTAGRTSSSNLSRLESQDEYYIRRKIEDDRTIQGSQNPYYEIDTLLDVKKLNIMGGGYTNWDIYLTEVDREKLINSLKSQPGYQQYELHMCLYTDDLAYPTNWKYYDQRLDVNGYPISLPKVNKKISQIPSGKLVISTPVRIPAMMTIPKVNRFTVRTSEYTARFYGCVVTAIVRMVQTYELLDKVRAYTVQWQYKYAEKQNKSAGASAAQKPGLNVHGLMGMLKTTKKVEEEEDDIIASDVETIPLTDPLTLMRIETAAHGVDCVHKARFDLKTYLEFSSTSTVWNCPICDKKLPVKKLVIDDKFTELANKYSDSEEVFNVRMYPDGTHDPVGEDGRLLSLPSQDRSSKPVYAEKKADIPDTPYIDVVDLDDEDEDMGTAPASSQAPSAPTVARLTSPPLPSVAPPPQVSPMAPPPVASQMPIPRPYPSVVPQRQALPPVYYRQAASNQTCPLTQNQVINPMRNINCGHVYERDAILSYLGGVTQVKSCPVGGCNKFVGTKTLYPLTAPPTASSPAQAPIHQGPHRTSLGQMQSPYGPAKPPVMPSVTMAQPSKPPGSGSSSDPIEID